MTRMLPVAGFGSDHVFHISSPLRLSYKGSLEVPIPSKRPYPPSHPPLQEG